MCAYQSYSHAWRHRQDKPRGKVRTDLVAEFRIRKKKRFICPLGNERELLYVFPPHQPPNVFLTAAWLALATHYRQQCDSVHQGWVGAPSEFATFRFHDAVVDFVQRSVWRARNLAASYRTVDLFETFSSRSYPKSQNHRQNLCFSENWRVKKTHTHTHTRETIVQEIFGWYLRKLNLFAKHRLAISNGLAAVFGMDTST